MNAQDYSFDSILADMLRDAKRLRARLNAIYEPTIPSELQQQRNRTIAVLSAVIGIITPELIEHGRPEEQYRAIAMAIAYCGVERPETSPTLH